MAGTHSSLHKPRGSRPPFSFSKSETRAKTPTIALPETTNTHRSWRRARCSRCFQFPADRIEDTDPCQVNLLWREVMASKTPSYAKGTIASRGKRGDTANEPSQVSAGSSAPSHVPTNSSAPPTSTATITKKSGATNATVRDADFSDTQLISRGIVVDKNVNTSLGAVSGPHVYFRSKAPSAPDQSRNFYRSIVEESLAGRVEREIDDSIFLSMDADFVRSIHRAYRSLAEAGLPEPEFKAYACQNLFIGQYTLLANDTTRQLCAVRSLEWSVKPHEFDIPKWHIPPLLSPDNPPSKEFKFDIYPDCQFWLCDKILNANYRADISSVVHCKALGSFCPYFSIEFKARTDSNRTVLNQVAAAGSLSLFNRYQLKLDVYPNPTPEQLRQVRHYGLTMEKDNWIVWLFEPEIADGAWAGCKIQFLDRKTCKTEQGVFRLLAWINEIHRWGLCEYALGCEDDIKRILSRAPTNHDVSSMDPADLEPPAPDPANHKASTTNATNPDASATGS